MTPYKLLDESGHWFHYSEIILDITDDLIATTVFCKLCNLHEYYHKTGMLQQDMFYCTNKQLCDKMKISATILRNSIKLLTGKNLISVHKRGGKHGISYYRINMNSLRTGVNNFNTGCKENNHQEEIILTPWYVDNLHQEEIILTPGVNVVHTNKIKKLNHKPKSEVSKLDTKLDTDTKQQIAEKYVIINGEGLTIQNFTDRINSDPRIHEIKTKLLNRFQNEVEHSKASEEARNENFKLIVSEYQQMIKNLEK